MLLLSFNIKGLGGDPKRRAIYDLINSYKPDLVMFQENLSSSSKAIDFL